MYSIMNAKMMQLEKSACNYNNFDLVPFVKHLGDSL